MNLAKDQAATSVTSPMAGCSQCSSATEQPAGAVPTEEEKAKLFGTLIAYSGTYVLDGDKVTHKIDVSWNQSWTGADQVRFSQESWGFFVP
jgi:hypothetical protein